ncbi:MAG TPA: LysM peptidoglycan-binding domain-containing protein [Opitutaceae bacterium]
MHTRSFLPGALALLALALLPGCGGDSLSLSSETDDPSYRDGLQLERQGRWDEALAAYLRVVDKRGDAAPESNLAAGVMYLNHTQNPIFAIYHFSKYLELEPNSKKASMVRGMIDSAKREFARTLPGQPLESVTEHLGLEEQAARLQRENDDLKAENAALRAGVTVPVMHSTSIDLAAIPTAKSLEEPSGPVQSDGTSAISLAPESGGSAAPAITEAPEDAAPAKAAAPSAGRRHTVARGDTLFSLSLKYYGSRSKWRDIYAANRGVLASENSPLKIGTDLKIP